VNAGQVEVKGVPGTAAGRSRVLVECAAVSKTFTRGRYWVGAVREVSCAVEAGMRVALTGSSGSGKSTLLHLLGGLETPTTGAMTWPGLGGLPRRPGAVGIVFQGPSLIPALDVAENVALPLRLAGVADGDADERAGAALDRLRIADLAAKLPEQISGGQAQRVAVARVLAARPRLILADEPTGQLDRDTGTRVLSVLLEVTEQLDAALVVATHDPAVATRLAVQWRMADGLLSVEMPT
jgi:ABC-type lipoprotein export system ATPase subunit